MADTEESKQSQTDETKSADKTPAQTKPDPPPDRGPLRVFKRSV